MEISIQIQFIKVNSSKSFRSYYLRRALSAKAELVSYGHKQSNFPVGRADDWIGIETNACRCVCSALSFDHVGRGPLNQNNRMRRSRQAQQALQQRSG